MCDHRYMWMHKWTLAIRHRQSRQAMVPALPTIGHVHTYDVTLSIPCGVICVIICICGCSYGQILHVMSNSAPLQRSIRPGGSLFFPRTSVQLVPPLWPVESKCDCWGGGVAGRGLAAQFSFVVHHHGLYFMRLQELCGTNLDKKRLRTHGFSYTHEMGHMRHNKKGSFIIWWCWIFIVHGFTQQQHTRGIWTRLFAGYYSRTPVNIIQHHKMG